MPRFDPNDPDLLDDLELACLDLMRGDAWGPQMATRLERTCKDVLRRWGAKDPIIQATSTHRQTAIRIGLRKRDKSVHEIVLRLGQ